MLSQVIVNSQSVSINWLYLAVVIVIVLMGIISILVNSYVKEIYDYQIHYEKVLKDNEQEIIRLNDELLSLHNELSIKVLELDKLNIEVDKLNIEVDKFSYRLKAANKYKETLKTQIVKLKKQLTDYTKIDNVDNVKSENISKKISRKKPKSDTV